MSKKIMLQPELLSRYIEVFWDYYISFEQDYLSLKSDPKENHIALTKLMLSICSEVEVLMKTICQTYDPAFQKDRMDQLREKMDEIITNQEWDSIDVTVEIGNDKYRPWEHFDENVSLTWWTKYNKLKHQRTSFIEDGKIFFDSVSINDIKVALSALYILEYQYMEYMSGYLESCPQNIHEAYGSKVFNSIIA